MGRKGITVPIYLDGDVNTNSSLEGKGSSENPLKMSGTFIPDNDGTGVFTIYKADGVTKILEVDTTNMKIVINGGIDFKRALSGNNIVTVTSNKTIGLSDNGTVQKCTSSSATTIMIPPDSTTDFPDGSEIVFSQYGAGQVILAEGSGVTINSIDGNLRSNGQYSGMTIKKIGTDQWWLVGNITT